MTFSSPTEIGEETLIAVSDYADLMAVNALCHKQLLPGIGITRKFP